MMSKERRKRESGCTRSKKKERNRSYEKGKASVREAEKEYGRENRGEAIIEKEIEKVSK